MFRKLLLLLVLSAPVVTDLQAQSDPFIQDFLLRWENAKQYTLAVAESMPDSLFAYKPVPEEMSFAGQLLHMAQNIEMLTQNYLPKNNHISVPQLPKDANAVSSQQIKKLLSDCFDYARKVIAGIDENQLEEQVPFFAGSMSRRRVIMLLNDHQTHHRGQLIVYLRLNHISPPSYVGW